MPRLDELRDHLKTGDLVLFSGRSAMSGAIKLLSGGKWSHVGMVVRPPDPGGGVFLWESTVLCDVPDAETQRSVKGVQLVPLAERVRRYNGEINWRALTREVTPEMLSGLGRCRARLAGAPYETSELEMLLAAYDWVAGASRSEALESVYCAELVAEAYQAMGLLPEYPDGLPSNEYTPFDFSADASLRLLLGYELGPEVELIR